MADIIKIAPNNQYGQVPVRAASLFREAFSLLEQYDGVRNQAISESQAQMKAVFGTATEQDAQTLSDRWGSLLDVITNPNSGAFGNFVYLRDFMNNIINDTGQVS